MSTNTTARREALAVKQAELAAIFEQAKTGDGQLDLARVTALGDNLTPLAKAEKVRAMSAEIDAIGHECEALEAAEAALKAAAERQAARSPMRHPGAAPGGDASERYAGKSLGQIVTGDAGYKSWVKSGAPNGVSFSFEDLWPSDALSKSAEYPTMGRKLFSLGAGWSAEAFRQPGFVDAVARPPQLIDILPMSRTGSDRVIFMEETTRTHAAAERAEGVLYPTSTFVLTERTSPVRKIADSVPVTDEQLEDVAQAESYLNNRLMFGVQQRLDAQCLVGDGVAANLRGILNTVGIQTLARATHTNANALFMALTRVRTIGRATPTHFVMHSTDWELIRLLRDSNGNYIWGPPSEAGPARIWGLPVILNEAGAAGTAYAGSFLPAWISLFERRGVDVQVGFVGDQFAMGRRTMRADARFALAVFRPAAFCTVTGIVA